VDAPRRDLRRSRAGALNLIPTTTSASIALEEILPPLKGRIQGMAIRVPAPAVSLTEITIQVAGRPEPEEVRRCLEEAARGPLAGILRLEEEELVSMDFVGDPASSVVDAPLIQVQDSLIRLIAWYDNERGYIRRLVDLLEYLEGKGFWPGSGW
jgi:glyceraldehyde 3-phosphate dehydrogenase